MSATSLRVFPVVWSLLCLLFLFSSAGTTNAETNQALAQYQKIFLKQQNKGLDTLLAQFDEEKNVYKADTSVTYSNYLSPEKKHILVVISRTSPDILDPWLFIIMNTRTLAVERVFDFLRATGVEKIQWLDEDRFIVHSRKNNLAGPPGELFLVNARGSRAQRIDENVWQYFIDDKTREYVFYEKSLNADEPYAQRQLKSCHLSNLQKKHIYEVKHPVTQFGKLGPLESEGSFFGFEVQTYGETFEPDIAKWWFDTMTEKVFKKKEEKPTEPEKKSEAN